MLFKTAAADNHAFDPTQGLTDRLWGFALTNENSVCNM